VIYEYGEKWWNDNGKGKFLIRPPQFSGNPISSHLVANQEELCEENYDLAFELSLFTLRSDVLQATKSYLGTPALLPLQKKCDANFYRR
jgi:hypothetical protein